MIPTHRHYMASLLLDFILGYHIPREVSPIFSQGVDTWLPVVWNWVREAVWDLGIQDTFLCCSCLIHTLPSCLGSLSLRPFILFSLKRLTLQTSAGAERDICPGACRRGDTGKWLLLKQLCTNLPLHPTSRCIWCNRLINLLHILLCGSH